MHVVRNVLLRPVLPTYCRRGVSTAATLATNSMTLPAVPYVSRKSPRPDVLANGSGFERFMEFTGPHASTVSKGKKRKQKQKFKTHTRLMAKSRDATVLHKDLSSCLIQTLQSMEPHGKQHAPRENPTHTKKKRKQKTSASSRPGRGIDGWAKEDWGTDELRPRGRQLKDLPSDTRKLPPHIKRRSTCTRRLEGLLAPLDYPILQDVEPISQHRPIAQLNHQLDRVLFNPGVHWLQDPRTGVYNFTPWLENIPNVQNFAFERLDGFVKSSRDEDLWSLAKREGRIFGGSTSSLTGMLCHIYFLISGDRDVDVSSLSRHFQNQPATFTPGQRMPTSVLLNYKDGVYTIDSLQEADDPEKNILTWMGILLEKLLTMSPENFSRLLRDSSSPVAPDADPRREAYRYAKSNRFVMRSQLDCHDSRLPGTGVFDLKTRAVLPIRLDMLNHEEHAGYQIRTLQGPLESFEKEYYDLIRSAFLKYSFQARIGNMDGVLVAHHNTSRIFGFQYIALAEMDVRLFGDASRGDRVFEKCVLLLEEVLMEAIACFPNQSIRCLFETRESNGLMNVWIEPEDHDEKVSGPRPIVQLDVESVSYFEEKEVRATTAVAGQQPWLLRWSVSRSSSSDEEKQSEKRGAEDRKFRAWSLPSGVDPNDMKEFWNQMDYGGKRLTGGDDVGSTFDPAYFRPASENIEMLRQLSREGKEFIDKKKTSERGKPKVVLYHPVQVGRVAESGSETSSASVLHSESSNVRDPSSLTNATENIGELSEEKEMINLGNVPTVKARHGSDTRAHPPTISCNNSGPLVRFSGSTAMGDSTLVPGPETTLENGHGVDVSGNGANRDGPKVGLAPSTAVVSEDTPSIVIPGSCDSSRCQPGS